MCVWVWHQGALLMYDIEAFNQVEYSLDVIDHFIHLLH